MTMSKELGLREEDSLNKRYFFKLLANIISLILNLLIQAIIPRGLGPNAYGDFNFLSSFFTQLVAFFDMGTSTCFYTKLSQRSQESSLVSFYLYFSGILFAIIISFIFISKIFSVNEYIWPNQKLLFIYLAALWSFLTWIMTVMGLMVDAYGLTVIGEKARILQRCMATILIIFIYIFHQLDLINLFFYHYIILIFIIGSYIWIITCNGFVINLRIYFLLQNVKAHLQEFYVYSHPLFITALIGLIAGIFDRWVLQIFAGSVQQGFFGLSYQVSTICILFTTAMSPLLTRELTIAYSQKDLAQMAQLFRRYLPALYSIAAYFSCFIAFQAGKVISIMAGSHFRGALVAIAIMALYPMHQTYGQLTGSVFYASGQTVTYRNISIVITLVGLPLTYLLIAPKNLMGFETGSTGLAIKMVLLNIIGVNVQLYFASRFLKIRFSRYILHQIGTVAFMAAIAFTVKYVVDEIVFLPGGVLANFLIAGLLYSIIIIIVTYYYPILFGISKQDVRSIFHILRTRFA